MAESKDNFFSQHGICFSPTDSKRETAIPFKQHPQFPVIIDILSRKNHHHAILHTDFSPSLQPIFFEALIQHLNHEQIPHHLRGASLIFLNLEQLLLTDLKQIAIEKDIENLQATLAHTDKYLLIALTNMDLFTNEPKKSDERFLRRQLELLLNHPQCRLLLLTNTKTTLPFQHLDHQFTHLHLSGPSETDILTLLQQQQAELEAFHHVTIPTELLTEAFLLAERYISTTHTLESTQQLLDSAAARAGTTNHHGQNEPFKPILTTTTLLNVLADWTSIPSTHLPLNHFKHAAFTQTLQHSVVGQDTAITIIGHELLQSQARLLQKTGPYSTFLFAGAAHSGKKTTARALTEYLFKQANALYFAQPPLKHHTLADVKLQRSEDKQFLPLTEVIRQTPYAVIVFENIERLSSNILDGLQEIFNTGILHDTVGHQYNFRQSIIILSTTVGSNSLAELAESFIPTEDLYTMDLMQLVMSDSKNDSRQPMHQFSPQEIIEKMMPEITEALPLSLIQHVHLVPFLPLTKATIEKIIRYKLKALGKQLTARYNVELGYAPEVIRFVTNTVLLKRDPTNQSTNVSKALKQLYFCIEQTILTQAESSRGSNQLFLQLNETGHSLHCDWLALTMARETA